MDSSSIPGSAVQPGEFLVYDKLFGENPVLKLKLELMLIYGSLTRPPESCSTSWLWRKFTNLVCLWSPIASGNLSSVDDVVVLWSSSQVRDVHREVEFWCDRLRQDHACGFGTRSLAHTTSSLPAVVYLQYSWLDFPESFASPRYLLRQRELWLAKSKILAILFHVNGVDGLDVLRFAMVYLAKHEVTTQDGLWLLPRKMNAAFKKESCCSEALLLFVAERLTQLPSPHIFHGALCVDLTFQSIRHGFHELNNLIQQMETSSESCCFLLASLCACSFRRQGELLPRRTNVLGALIHIVGCAFAGQRLLHSSASYTTLLSPCFIDFLEEFLRFDDVFSVCASTGCCCLDHVVRIPPELLLRQRHMKKLFSVGWSFHFFLQEQSQDCGVDVFLAPHGLLLKQNLPPVFLLTVPLHANGDGDFDNRWTDFGIGCQVIKAKSRDIEFFGQIIAANSGWFGSFLTFFYGSSPRPPDVQCVFGFDPLNYPWGSQAYRVF